MNIEPCIQKLENVYSFKHTSIIYKKSIPGKITKEVSINTIKPHHRGDLGEVGKREHEDFFLSLESLEMLSGVNESKNRDLYHLKIKKCGRTRTKNKIARRHLRREGLCIR